MPFQVDVPRSPELVSTGIPGLDAVLRGGLPRGDMHLIRGTAGTGKTTLALQFLLAGVEAGEAGLYVTLSQTRAGLERIAQSHGWSIQALSIHELSPGELLGRVAVQQSVLHTADVELGELTGELRSIVDEVKPRRVVLDSMGILGLLAGSASRYHREIVGLREFLTHRGCTSLFIEDPPSGADDEQVSETFSALVGSVIRVEQTSPGYGEARRRLCVVKMRSVPFRTGYHDLRIDTGGITVFPRLGPTPGRPASQYAVVPSGIRTLDTMLGGGLEQGTTCLILGSPGCGKSTLSSVYTRAIAERGEHAAVFIFDERPETWTARAHGVGVDLRPHIESGRVVVHQPDAASLTAGEFAQSVRTAVERDNAKLVVLDSLTGYINAMGHAEMLVVQMHELLNYLCHHDVLTLLLVVKQGFMSVGPPLDVDVSYLSDSILVLTMFEVEGKVRRCLTSLKKRQGEHDTTIRELIIRAGTVSVSEEPLDQYRRLMSGHPERIPLERPAGG